MRWEVPLSDLSFDEREERAVAEVLKSRWLSIGEKTLCFEREFAEFTAAKHAIAVSSCTAALHIAHSVLGAKPGSEVIIPSLTFVATANTVLATGATPVFADVDSLDNWCISARTIEPLITPKTVGVVVVHYGGYPAGMGDIVELCKRHHLYLVEDCAHSPGAYWQQTHTGRFGEFGCFSFFSNKNIATGEGGMVITDSNDLAEKARLLRSHGMTTITWQRHEGHASSYDVTALGYNYRIDEIRSALGLVQLSKVVENNQRRAKLVARYRQLLAEVPRLKVPFGEQLGISSYHLFPVLLDLEVNRDYIMAEMKQAGIQTSVHYPACHLFTYMRSRLGTREGMLPLTEQISRRALTLPLFPDLTAEQVDKVVTRLGSLLGC